MTVFICGGSASGKSAFAESVAQKLGGSLVYVATMPVNGPEDAERVERHHRLRAGKGFVTLERQNHLSALPDDGETILIESIETHVANLMFSPDTAPDDAVQNNTAHWVELLKAELAPLLTRSGNTIFVSSVVSEDGVTYSPETELYKKVLNAIHCFLAEQADAVYEMVCGIPVRIKGELPCLKV